MTFKQTTIKVISYEFQEKGTPDFPGVWFFFFKFQRFDEWLLFIYILQSLPYRLFAFLIQLQLIIPDFYVPPWKFHSLVVHIVHL